MKRRYIPQHVREEVWRRFGGPLCWCCQDAAISAKNKHFGHIKAEANGGAATVENLRPVCQHCNLRMGTMNMYDFMIHNKYPIHDAVMVEKILVGTSNKDKLQMLQKPVFLTPANDSYVFSIGTMSLFTKYPFLKPLNLLELFTKSTVHGICIFFITSKTYNDWFVHMAQRPSMDNITTALLKSSS